MPALWTTAFPIDELSAGEARVFVSAQQRVAVFHLVDGSLAAIDDRCPHEGYPLAKGFVNGCVVTCRWHAFRFDLRDGKCLVGDEHARAYPVRVVAGLVELDLRPPDANAERARHEASLVRGLERRRTGQIARDVVRLLDAGVSPRELMLIAVRFDAARAPYGTSHVPALAHDLLERLPVMRARHGADGEVAMLLQALDLAAEANLGFPVRPRPAPAAPNADPEVALRELRAKVESEDADGAEAIVRGAVLAGTPLAVLEGWFHALVSDHLLDIGHGLIYPPKVFALLAESDAQEVELVLGALVRRITNGTREELVPEWGWVLRAIEAPSSPDAVDPDGGLAPFIRALLDGSRRELFEALARASANQPFDALVDALVIAASLRLLRYDLQIELDPTIQEDWLDVTHALTLASSLRHYADLDATARRRILILTSAFVHSRGGLDAPADLRVLAPAAEAALFDAPADARAAPASSIDAAIESLNRGLERREPDVLTHVAATAYALDRAALVAALEDWCLMRGAVRGIFGAHQWKTLVAADHESAHLAASDDPLRARCAHLPLCAAARFIGSPLAERVPLQAAHEALRFVRESRVPRRRT